ncbi:hypothetical protein [Luteimonas notoginsengisoli]|jgi:hypothetical protein|uniref:Uncharacterized protein n=1 Tax=Luteimonas notoginsengisoli TaxID=1578200 RepID=A0ABV7UVM5_9GAMM
MAVTARDTVAAAVIVDRRERRAGAANQSTVSLLAAQTMCALR